MTKLSPALATLREPQLSRRKKNNNKRKMGGNGIRSRGSVSSAWAEHATLHTYFGLEKCVSCLYKSDIYYYSWKDSRRREGVKRRKETDLPCPTFRHGAVFWRCKMGAFQSSELELSSVERSKRYFILSSLKFSL